MKPGTEDRQPGEDWEAKYANTRYSSSQVQQLPRAAPRAFQRGHVDNGRSAAAEHVSDFADPDSFLRVCGAARPRVGNDATEESRGVAVAMGGVAGLHILHYRLALVTCRTARTAWEPRERPVKNP